MANHSEQIGTFVVVNAKRNIVHGKVFVDFNEAMDKARQLADLQHTEGPFLVATVVDGAYVRPREIATIKDVDTGAKKAVKA